MGSLSTGTRTGHVRVIENSRSRGSQGVNSGTAEGSGMLAYGGATPSAEDYTMAGKQTAAGRHTTEKTRRSNSAGRTCY